MDYNNQASTAASWADRYIVQDDKDGVQTGQTDGVRMLDAAYLKGVIWRQRYVIGGVLAMCVLASLIVTLLIRPTYEATATVRVEQQDVPILEGQNLAPSVSNGEVSRYFNTQVEVIQSRSMARAVAEALNLDREPAFVGQGTDKSGSPLPREARLNIAVTVLRAHLMVKVPSNARILAISYTSNDAREAAKIASAYASQYVNGDAQRASDTNSYARKILKQQIAATSDRLSKSQAQAIAYARANRIIMPATLGGGINTESGGQSSGGGQTITGTTLMAMNVTHAQLEGNAIQAEQRWKVVKNISPLGIPAVQQNAAIQTLQAKKADLISQLAQFKRRYAPGYPQIDELQSQIGALGSQIDDAAQQIKGSIRSDYLIARQQEQALAQAIAQISDQTLAEQDRQVKYNLVTRNIDATRTQLDSLLQRYNQVSAATDVHAANISLLDSAEVPHTPIAPKLWKNLLMALGAGIALAFAAAVLREGLDDSLHSPDDVENKLGQHLLGITPHVAEENLAKALGRNGVLSESYASLRTAIDYAAPALAHRLIQFTSSQGSEGKTTTTSSLARQYAALGRRVLVMDCDLRRPVLDHAMLGRKVEKGLVDVLTGQSSFQEVVLKDHEYPNMDVLPCGPVSPHPVEMLASAAFAELLATHRKSYDLILIDSPPVIGLADAPTLARLVDQVIFIVEANRSHYGQAKAAIRRIQNVHGNILGAVLTKYRAKEAGGAYDYTYSYYSQGQINKGDEQGLSSRS
jgi:capsular exopolysaccharide synthesis family protein